MDDADVIRRAAENMAAMWAHVARASGGREERWPDAHAADASAPNPVVNRTTVLSDDAEAEQIVGRADEFYAKGTGGRYGIVDMWARMDLSAHGFDKIAELPCMVRRPGGSMPAVPDGVTVEQVMDAAGIEAFKKVVYAGFTQVPWPETDDALFGEGFASDTRCGVWVARVEGQPVSCSVSMVAEQVVGVYLVATLPTARGRGLGELMSWAATMAAPELPAVLQASAMGYPIYQRMGYRDVRTFPFWVRRSNAS